MRFATAFALLVLAGCTARPHDAAAPADDPSVDARELDAGLFLDAALLGEVTEEPCVLSGGTEATCVRFTVSPVPPDHAAGPWCPSTIRDAAEAGGVWPEGGVLCDVDGPFIAGLATFYDDPAWKLYEDDGAIRVTDSAEACAAAARPDVDEAYTNYCVQCQTAYLDPGMAVTYVLPKRPVSMAQPGPIGNPVGVALNGIGFDPPAPTDAILGAYTLAPFDDCGGHVNLHGGYHYHAATGCGTRVEQADGHAPQIGYALDGFPLFDPPGDGAAPLDECRGHADDIRGYHYHAAEPGENRFVGCFTGEHGCALAGDGDGQTCDATRRTGPPGGGRGGPPPGRRDDPFPTPHDHH